MQFTKPPLSVSQQISLLQSRGLLIVDTSKAEHFLNNVSYYRLSAYMLPLQIYGRTDHQFRADTNFEEIVDLYVFDKELKLLIFDAIERVEIALRTQIIYQLALKYGSHWQENSTLFSNLSVFNKLQSDIEDHLNQKNKEVFIHHYLKTYTNPQNPPCWMSLEIVTMGLLSQTYKALKNKKDKKDIADYFGLFPPVLESWMHTTSYVRNICAHHSRLWNRDFGVSPILLLSPKKPWIDPLFNNNGRVYYYLCCLKYLLSTVNPDGHFTQKLIELLQKYNRVQIRFMGFPPDWRNEPLWSS